MGRGLLGTESGWIELSKSVVRMTQKMWCAWLLKNNRSLIHKTSCNNLLMFQPVLAEPIFPTMLFSFSFFFGFKSPWRAGWLVLMGSRRADDCAGPASLRKTVVQAFHAWCLSACVCARAGCRSSGPGSPSASLLPLMAYRIFLAPGFTRSRGVA